jgi:hypothetical protein
MIKNCKLKSYTRILTSPVDIESSTYTQTSLTIIAYNLQHAREIYLNKFPDKRDGYLLFRDRDYRGPYIKGAIIKSKPQLQSYNHLF